MYDDGKEVTTLDAGMMIGEPNFPDALAEGIPYAVIPKTAQVHNLEHLLPEPLRIKRSVTLHDPASFTCYVKRFREMGTTIFFNQDESAFKAILDYHLGFAASEEVVQPAPQARWCEHIANYAVRPTLEWKAWTAVNGRPMRQSDFAHFIETHVDDVAEHFGGLLLKIALNLEIHNSVSFTNHQRLEDGSVKLQYEEDVKGTASVGQITIPPTFKLAIRPLVGGEKYGINCRFRYRLQDRAAMLWFEMVNLDETINDALGKIRTAIEADTGVVILSGE
jgi:uncharacterized protein YfdQ (DUF2303 family)